MTRQDEVPVELRRLWGLEEQSRMGRRAVLDVPQVVAAAVELADRDGLAGVTLPKVAAALGVTSMSLYRYAGSKDELLTLMFDAAIGLPPGLADADGWRDGLRRWAHALLAVHHRRPWLVRVPVTGPPSGPAQIAWMDSALGVLRETGLDWAAKVGVLGVLSGHVRQSAVLVQEFAEGRAPDLDQVDVERAYGRALAALVAPDRFPDAARLFASPLFTTLPDRDEGAPDPDFVFGLDLILDGVAAAVGRAG